MIKSSQYVLCVCAPELAATGWMRQSTDGPTCAVGKLCLHFVAGKRMAHVGIEPLLENIGGDLRVVVLWSIVARFLLSLGFVLRCRRLYACTCAFCVDACWARCRNRQPF